MGAGLWNCSAALSNRTATLVRNFGMTAEKSCNTRPATCAQRVSAAKAGADCPERDPSGIPQIFSGFFRCCHIFGVPIGEEEEEEEEEEGGEPCGHSPFFFFFFFFFLSLFSFLRRK